MWCHATLGPHQAVPEQLCVAYESRELVTFKIALVGFSHKTETKRKGKERKEEKVSLENLLF